MHTHIPHNYCIHLTPPYIHSHTIPPSSYLYIPSIHFISISRSYEREGGNCEGTEKEEGSWEGGNHMHPWKVQELTRDVDSPAAQVLYAATPSYVYAMPLCHAWPYHERRHYFHEPQTRTITTDHTLAATLSHATLTTTAPTPRDCYPTRRKCPGDGALDCAL